MKKVFVLLLLFTLGQEITACTTFLINKNGQLVFGRNYDWATGAGMVCTNLRGLQKTSLKGEGNTISWVSKFGSITFNQYGKEFPTGGMNEMGLVVELMWLDATKYPAADDRPAIGVLQWIQYQLDVSATVDEVIATNEVVRITSQEPPLHYLVADASGNVATIEFLNGTLVVHRGKDLPFPVLTNNTYEESVKKVESGKQSFQENSIERFSKACGMVQKYQLENVSTPAVDYAFNILDEVAQKDWTKWSIVYDITAKKISFKSHGFATIKTVSFSAFDFSCSVSTKMYNMSQRATGEVSGFFEAFSIDKSKPILDAAIEESKTQVTISQPQKEALLNYFASVRCR